MYLPRAFREDDLGTLHALMQQHSFATLVTQQDGGMEASHLPLLLEPQEGPYGTLLGHMARANPQWQTFATHPEVLVIFQGPHAYVSPSWYTEALSVPTWNYTAVHAYGRVRVMTQHDESYATLQKLVQYYEAGFAKPWPFTLPDAYVHRMMQGIVCFAIAMTRLEGKYKLSQNRSLLDQQRVVAALQNSAMPLERDVAMLMASRIATETP